MNTLEELYLEAKSIVNSNGWDHERIKEIIDEIRTRKIKLDDLRPLEAAIFGVEKPEYLMEKYGNPKHDKRGLLLFDISNLSLEQLKTLLIEKKNSPVSIIIEELIAERSKTSYRGWFSWFI